MLVGVATRQYARSLDALPADVPSRGTSKSAVSRRFVAKTQAQLETWQARPLDDLALAVLLLDGVHVGEHCLIVALGVTEDGTKHALGLWDGSTENSTVCQSLLANLQSRGLRTDRSLLVILDGSKALHKAVRMMFGEAALVQRCQIHKLRNVLDHLPERQRPWVKAILQRAYRQDDVATAKRLLQDLARRLDGEYPSAAESVREGLGVPTRPEQSRPSPARADRRCLPAGRVGSGAGGGTCARASTLSTCRPGTRASGKPTRRRTNSGT